MPRGLRRYHFSGQSHFITFSCYRRRKFLLRDDVRRILTQVLEETRKRFNLLIYGFVWMPEHIHILISEPENGLIADAIHHFKLSSSKLVKTRVKDWKIESSLWQKRYFDRNVRDYDEFQVKLQYTHRNPVKRGLCAEPGDWPWSSFRHYAFHEDVGVEIESEWTARKRPPLVAKTRILPG